MKEAAEAAWTEIDKTKNDFHGLFGLGLEVERLAHFYAHYHSNVKTIMLCIMIKINRTLRGHQSKKKSKNFLNDPDVTTGIVSAV